MARWPQHQVKNHQFWPNTGILGYLRFQMTKMKFWIRGSFCTVRSNFWCFMILSDKKRFLSKNFEKKFWKIKNFRFFQLAAEILQRLLRFLRRLQRLPCWDCRDSISAEIEPLVVPVKQQLLWPTSGMHRTCLVCRCGWAGHRWECTGHATSVDAVRAKSEAAVLS